MISDQVYFTKKQKKLKYFIFLGNGSHFVFEKKIMKKIFFKYLRGQKSKIGCFYEFIPGFPKRLGRIVFEH